MLFPSPEDLEALARRLDSRADDVAEQVRAFDRDVAEVRWHSDGAERYRGDCADLARNLRGNVEDLHHAADVLRAHARDVRSRIEWMHDAFDRLKQEAEQAWDSVEHTADEVFSWGEKEAGKAWHTVTSWF